MTRISLLLASIWIALSALVYGVGLVPVPLLLLYVQFVGAVLVLYCILAGVYDWATPFLVCLSATMFFLVVGDTALRFLLADNLYFRPHERLFEKSPLYPESYRYSPNRLVTQLSTGDLANFTCKKQLVEERLVTFRTDAYGFRNDQQSLDTSYEIILLGDSFGVANGTSQEHTWWHLLAEQRGVSLYNLSLPSAPRQEVSVLARELPRLKLKPHVTVIWQLFEGNDLEDVPPPKLPDMQRSAADRIVTHISNYQRRSPLVQLLGSMGSDCPRETSVERLSVPQHGEMLFYSDYSVGDLVSESDVQQQPGWRFLQDAFESMAQLRSTYGFRVLVVTIPSKSQVYGSQKRGEELSSLARLIGRESKKRGFRHISVQPGFVRATAQTSEPLYWRDDTHLSIRGNRLLASLVNDALDDGMINPN